MLGATERFLGGVCIYQLLLLFLPTLYVCFPNNELFYYTAIICFLGTLTTIVLNLVTFGMQTALLALYCTWPNILMEQKMTRMLTNQNTATSCSFLAFIYT